MPQRFSVSALAPHGSYASILEGFLDFLDAIRGDLVVVPGYYTQLIAEYFSRSLITVLQSVILGCKFISNMCVCKYILFYGSILMIRKLNYIF